MIKRNLVKLIQKMIDGSKPQYYSCHGCGLVFNKPYFLHKHQEETGHRNPDFNEYMSTGLSEVFEKLATTPRRIYFQDADVAEENTKEE